MFAKIVAKEINGEPLQQKKEMISPSFIKTYKEKTKNKIMAKKYIWQLRSSMMRNLGIVRNERSILRGLTETIKIERESQGLSAKLNDMILVSKFIIIGAYKRMESRGCHLRSDFLESKKEFLTHIDQTHSDLEKDIQWILKNKGILKKEDSLAS